MIAASTRLRPLARWRCASKLRSRSSPKRLKQTALASEFLSSGVLGTIGTKSPVKPSSSTIAASCRLFLVNSRIAQWPQFAPRYRFRHREWIPAQHVDVVVDKRRKVWRHPPPKPGVPPSATDWGHRQSEVGRANTRVKTNRSRATPACSAACGRGLYRTWWNRYLLKNSIPHLF